MEKRSNFVLVGAVALAMVIGIFVMVVWLSRYSGGDHQDFDIYFKQSVNGLAVGSPVAFNGVPVGKITEIRIPLESPQLVRVRIQVNEDVPVLKGTTAAVEGVGFTGVSQIQLRGVMQGAEPITEPGRYGVPVIPARTGGLGELLNTAPEIVANVAKLTDRLNDVLRDENRAALNGMLKNLDVTTAALAKSTPDLAAALTEARATMAAATAALHRVDALAASGQTVVESDIRPLAADLRRAAASTQATMARVEAIAGNAQPAVDMLSNQTLPEITQLIRELRETSSRLGAVAAKLDEDPAGTLIGGRTLPEYQPPKEDQK
ncbi:MlaD family protein [Sandarakinorhabdus sp.]|jgi:phospholipid/cholesterol/gamma-HCH transport system substrate-binding protein|uniref:MlaD family protein n=1 Tax=Sandarakinorhabdus sp. TaxID=1916663 RepID=UPI00333F25EF